MSESEISDRVAGLLAQVWRNHQQPMFQMYLSTCFCTSASIRPSFLGICIAEFMNGDVNRGDIETWHTIRSWLVDPQGFRLLEWNQLPEWINDHNDARSESRDFYKYPLVRFFRSGDLITFGEAYGPELACRKRGRFYWDCDELSILDVEVLWRSADMENRLQFKPLLDFVPGGVRMVVLAGSG